MTSESKLDVSAIAEILAPLRVTVTSKEVKGKFYIHFDGTKTYKSADTWDTYWNGFENCIKNAVEIANPAIVPKKTVGRSKTQLVWYLGNLFDLLK